MNAPLVNPRLLKEIKRYGAADISACFNCGNCSAVCPLSEGTESFPRRVIRLGQIGRTEELLSSDEPWLCFYCGECTRTCPRQADPGGFMAAVRRFTIARLEPTGMGRLLLKNSVGGLVVTLVLAMALGLFLMRLKVRSGEAFQGWPFSALVAYETVHAVGMGVGLLLAASLAISVGHFVWLRTKRVAQQNLWNPPQVMGALRRTLADVVTLRRHRSEVRPVGRQWLRDPWLIHIMIAGGFMGLFLATLLDFVFLYLLKDSLQLTIFWPARALGTVAGLVFLAGTLLAVVRRFRRDGPSAAVTHPSDGWLLFFLALLAVTGFWIEIVVTFGLHNTVSDWILLVHSIAAMELVLLAGATKLAHVLYRPLALFFMHLRAAPVGAVVPSRGCGASQS